MADTILTTTNQAGGREAHESNENTGTLARIATGVRTATLALAIGVGTAQAQQPSEPVRGPILMAQANVEKQEYVVYVRQVDENGNLTDKTIEVRYTKSQSGAIMPPKVSNGKLLDGSKASGDEGEDRRANRRILGQYDKDIQIVLAMTDKADIIGDATRKMENFTKKVKNNESLSKAEIFDMYYAIYIFSNANPNDTDGRTKKAINATEVMANKMHILPQEIDSIHQKAKEEAIKRWQSVTRSLG